MRHVTKKTTSVEKWDVDEADLGFIFRIGEAINHVMLRSGREGPRLRFPSILIDFDMIQVLKGDGVTELGAAAPVTAPTMATSIVIV